MEVWKDIKGFGGYYQISSIGRVKSFKRYKEGRIRSISLSKKQGYPQVKLCKKGKETCHRIHRLVAMAFLGNPENKRTVNHKDGDKLNNHVDNLEWNTYSENNQHAHDKGLNKAVRGEDHSYAKLTQKDVSIIRKLLTQGVYHRIIAERFGVSRTSISLINAGKNWKG